MMQIITFIAILSLMLTGCLPAVFTAATGTALVAAKDQPMTESINDTKIATSINTSFIKNNFKQLYTKIKIEVNAGRVLMTGSVDNHDDILKAVEIVWSIEGVKEVINELTVDKNSARFDLVQYTKDTMITSQIKTKTFLDRGIKCVNYTIVTINDVVYIFGTARSLEELEKVTSIASQVGGVARVVSHARIREITQDENKHITDEDDA